jgi:predicted transposase YbfD/YdcC
VFAALDAEQFQQCVMGWMSELANGLNGKLVAIDGKTVRGSFGNGQGPLHLVSAWVAENSLALAQLAVEDKSNEIVAIPRLLELLDLRGATVTIDAMGCQKAIAASIVGRGADYVLSLKDNHPTLHAEVAEFFEHAEQVGWRVAAHSTKQTTDGGHGRVEVRRVWASDDIEWLDVAGAWTGLRSVVMVERERTSKAPRRAAFIIFSYSGRFFTALACSSNVATTSYPRARAICSTSGRWFSVLLLSSSGESRSRCGGPCRYYNPGRFRINGTCADFAGFRATEIAVTSTLKSRGSRGREGRRLRNTQPRVISISETRPRGGYALCSWAAEGTDGDVIIDEPVSIPSFTLPIRSPRRRSRIGSFSGLVLDLEAPSSRR